MTIKIFIDGEAGTTGLQIREKLAGFAGIELLSLPAQARKDVGAKRELLGQVDLTILCLPDAAAKEAAALLDAMGERAPRVIDASSAHRVAPGWVYGFPELAPGQDAAIAGAAQGEQSGLSRDRRDRAAAAVDGRGADPEGRGDHDRLGHRLFRRRQDDDRGLRERTRARFRTLWPRPRAQARAGNRGLFRPDGASAVRPLGRQFPPRHAGERSAAPGRAAGAAERRRSARGAGSALSAAAAMSESPTKSKRRLQPRLEPESLNGSNNMEIHVCANEARRQAVLVAKLDNLGKGASGAAVQNLSLMTGLSGD